MAARLRLHHQDEVREKIRASQLVNRLQDHAFGKNEMSATQLKAGDLIEVTLENGAVLKSKSVILATGARWREMNVPGEQEYRGKGVAYCPHCDGPLFKGKRVAVIGGGNSGVEAAIDLAGVVSHVTLIEFDDELRADAVLQRKLASLANVDVVVGALTTEVSGDGEEVTDTTKFAAYYILWLPRGTIQEQSIDPASGKLKSPLAIDGLATSSLIQGWKEGMKGMRLGGVRELTIPSDKGYKEQGTKDQQGNEVIPPNTPLKFIVMAIPAAAEIAPPTYPMELFQGLGQ